MAIWDSFKDRAAIDRLKDEAIHAAAMEEISSGRRRDGLWTKAIIESNGDEPRAKIAYLRLLVTAIRDDIYLAQRAEQIFSASQHAPAQPPPRSSSPPPTPGSVHEREPTPRTKPGRPPPGSVDDKLMSYYGITRVGDQYAYGTYRFSELKNALAHARHVESLKQGA